MAGFPQTTVGNDTASANAISVPWPTGHRADDIGLLYVAQAGTQPRAEVSGWTFITESDVGAGVGSIHLSLYWRRAVSGAEADASVSDTGDHQYGNIILVRGCRTSGDPFESVVRTGTNNTDSSTVTCGAVTTSGDYRLVLDFVGLGLDQSAAATSAWTNADLTLLTTIADAGSTAGIGSVAAVNQGIRRKAGTLAATTLTVSPVAKSATISLAMIPDSTSYPVINDSAQTGVSTSGTNHVYNLPTYYQSGDLLVASVAVKPISGAATPTWPVGWTTVVDEVNLINGSNYRSALLYKVSDGSEGSTFTLTTSTNARSSAVILSVSNYSGAPLASARTTGFSANPDNASYTPNDSKKWLWLATEQHNLNTGVSTWPTSYDYFQLVAASGLSGNSSVVGARTFEGDTDDPSAYTLGSTREWTAYTVVVAPLVQSSFTADAVIYDIDKNAFQQDSFQKGSFQLPAQTAGSFTANAVLKTTASASFLVDAVIQKTFTGSITADGILKKQSSSSFTADACLKAALSASVTADAVLRKVLSASFTADAVVTASHTDNFTANAVLKKSFSSSFTADAVLKTTPSSSFTADSVLAISVENAFQSNAFQNGAFQLPSDVATNSSSITADSVIRKPHASGSFTADASIARAFRADAVLRKTRTSSLTADAVIVRPSFTADAVIRQTLSYTAFQVNAFQTNAYQTITSGTFSSFTADAVFINGRLIARAIIGKTFSGSFTADAVLIRTLTADAVLKKVGTGSISADAIIGQHFATFTADAIIYLPGTGQLTADAFLVSQPQGVSVRPGRAQAFREGLLT